MRASVLCLLLGATLLAADWPDYGGNPARYALLAAHADHAGQRLVARGRLDI